MVQYGQKPLWSVQHTLWHTNQASTPTYGYDEYIRVGFINMLSDRYPASSRQHMYVLSRE